MRAPAYLVPLALLLIAVPASANDVQIAKGHILVGHVGTLFLSTPVDSFSFDVTAYAGSTITTLTTDNSDLGYDLDLYFYDENGDVIHDCATSDSDEVCTIPPAAALGEVSAYDGADLDVSVVRVH